VSVGVRAQPCGAGGRTRLVSAVEAVANVAVGSGLVVELCALLLLRGHLLRRLLERGR
jgi:hypothetical protein